MRPGCFALLLAALLGCGFRAPEAVYTPPPPAVVTIQPPAVILTAGRRMTFGHRITSASGMAVAWRVLEPEGGAVDAQGHYTAPLQPGTYHVQVAATAEPDRQAVAEVRVVPAPGGAITAPDRVEGGASGLAASVPLRAGMTYAWSIDGGTLQGPAGNPEIHFTAGPKGPVVLHCRITNPAGDTLDLTREVPKAPPVVFRLARTAVTLTAGRSMKLGYTLSGGILPQVVWNLSRPDAGHVTPDGTYTAPWTPGTYAVRAMPDSAPEQAAQVAVTVVEPPFGLLFAPGTVDPGRTGVLAWVEARPGLKRAWSVSGGTLVGDATAAQVRFDPGQGPEVVLDCRLTNEAGDERTLERRVTVARP